MRLIRARELENVTEEDGRAVQYLRGDVEFQKGNTVLSSQRAYYRQREGLTSFVESVQMTRERQVLTVDSLVFDSNNDIATGFGHVHFTDGEYDLTSDTLTYFMNADSGIASGHVRFVQRKQIITARHLIYRKREGEDAASYTALGSVTILEEERKATCGKSIYDATEDFSVLLENPVVVQEGQTLSGNEIHLHYRDDTLERLTVPDRAHIVYRRTGKVQRRVEEGDSVSTGFLEKEFVDDMTGRRLEAYLVDGKLDSVRLEGMATTLYHLFQDSVYEGENVASGDTITLLFKPDSASGTEMESVHIVGGSRGEYHPSEDSEDITAPIFYRGETIHYDIPAQRTDLEKSARIDYQDTRLEAGHVTVTWEDNLLRASPGPDTLNGT
ncbi:MAG: LptA/OstA family protein, partial [Fidelibacterota bacterium]